MNTIFIGLITLGDECHSRCCQSGLAPLAAILDAVIATGSRDKSLMVVDVILAADIAVATGSRDGAVLTEAGRWP